MTRLTHHLTETYKHKTTRRCVYTSTNTTKPTQLNLTSKVWFSLDTRKKSHVLRGQQVCGCGPVKVCTGVPLGGCGPSAPLVLGSAWACPPRPMRHANAEGFEGIIWVSVMGGGVGDGGGSGLRRRAWGVGHPGRVSIAVSAPPAGVGGRQSCGAAAVTTTTRRTKIKSRSVGGKGVLVHTASPLSLLY